MIKKIFIANRGEIASRIAKTAKRLGIKTASLCEAGLAPPLFLAAEIDTMYPVAGLSSQTYLDGDLMIEIALKLGCDSLHPGFGFLSENFSFAEKVQAAKLVWIGPNSESMLAMASKDGSRKIAEKTGMPVNQAIPEFDPLLSLHRKDEILDLAEEIGYPLLVKASLGGGGKGMRIAENREELWPALERCRSEALSSFGDPMILIERYITSPRHVEVQIIGDKKGNVYAIGDRDCSLQRRHQKVIEESPAPFLKDSVRKQMHEAAVKLAKHVSYDSLGTVELLYDRENKECPFFFLEMNTRIQVEHPVTEEVFGLDLVEWQIRVACGHELPKSMGLIQARGHAIEARVYAENPLNDFFPSPGPVYLFKPKIGLNIRWDLGLDTSDEITGQFDPMIAKCTVISDSRDQAISDISQALKETILVGTENNLFYLSELVLIADFKTDSFSTKSIAENHQKYLKKHEEFQKELTSFGHRYKNVALPAVCFQDYLDNDSMGASSTRLAFQGSGIEQTKLDLQWLECDTLKSWRYFGRRVDHFLAKDLEQNQILHFIAVITSASYALFLSLRGGIISLRTRQELEFEQSPVATVRGGLQAMVPGKIVAVEVKLGDQVLEGKRIAVLESMKMEYDLVALQSGQVAEIFVAVGDQVQAGHVVCLIKEQSSV